MFFPEFREDNQVYSSAVKILKDHGYTEKKFRVRKICNGTAVFEQFDILHPLGLLKVKAYFKKVNSGYAIERYDIKLNSTTAYYEGESVKSFEDELKEALEKQDIKDWRK
jgi:hypothetical protein